MLPRFQEVDAVLAVFENGLLRILIIVGGDAMDSIGMFCVEGTGTEGLE